MELLQVLYLSIIISIPQLVTCDAKLKRWEEILFIVQKDFAQVHEEVTYLQTTVSNLREELSSLKKITQNHLPLDCSSALIKGIWSTVTLIAPPGHKPRNVRCDQRTEGGGWTVVVNRLSLKDSNAYKETEKNVIENFMRSWKEYQTGFGSPHHEYWLGNDVIHALTKDGPWEAMVIVKGWDGDSASGRWDFFRVYDEDQKYKLEVRGYRKDLSNLPDGLTYHNHRPFSTFDSDNDGYDGHCARQYGGGWWFHQCHVSHLTGKHLNPGKHGEESVHWLPWKNNKKSLLSAKLMIRPKFLH